MKLLLTGEPKSGKSTMLSKLLPNIEHKQGFLTEEVCPRPEDRRTGFIMRSEHGEGATLAQTAQPTTQQVGRFFVETASLQSFLDPLFTYEADDLLYIDEIGQMQLFSPEFKKLVTNYLTAANDFFGTISYVYHDDFIDSIRQREDVLLVELLAESRDEAEKALRAALGARAYLADFPEATADAVLSLAKEYAHGKQFISMYKLFNNAVRYLAEDRVRQLDEHHFEVRGDTNVHQVELLAEGMSKCDCPLFNGMGKYSAPAECSHIQAAKVLLK